MEKKVNKHLFIICGEASGDLNAACLAKEILRIDPEVKISGVGGRFLREAGVTIFSDIKNLAVLGLFDVLKKLPLFFSLKKLILEKIEAEKPDAIILVDFSGFNLRLAKAINKKIRVIYYISPQVWASRSGRIDTIKKYVHKLIVLFKFEEKFYEKHGLDVDFVGHPLLDITKPTMTKRELSKSLNLNESLTTIALLPGSRQQEIKNIFPIMLKSACIIRSKKPDTQFVVAKSTQLDWKTYQDLITEYNLDLKIIEGKTTDCLELSDFALVASGTATIETAIMQKPFAVIYKMSLLNYLLYRPQVKLPYIGMINIVAQKKIIPEFIQFKARPDHIAEFVLSALEDPVKLEHIKNDLIHVKSLLGEKGACRRAAEIVINYLNEN